MANDINTLLQNIYNYGSKVERREFDGYEKPLVVTSKFVDQILYVLNFVASYSPNSTEYKTYRMWLRELTDYKLIKEIVLYLEAQYNCFVSRRFINFLDEKILLLINTNTIIQQAYKYLNKIHFVLNTTTDLTKLKVDVNKAFLPLG